MKDSKDFPYWFLTSSHSSSHPPFFPQMSHLPRLHSVLAERNVNIHTTCLICYMFFRKFFRFSASLLTSGKWGQH